MLESIRDFIRLRKQTPDALSLCRIRRKHRVGQAIYARVPGCEQQGVQLRGGTQDVSVFFEIFARDTYRTNSLPARLGTVVDLGGNVGLFALRIAPRCERVLCFEPMPTNFERLQANTAGIANVEIHNCAASGADGVLTIYCANSARATGRFSAQPQEGLHDRAQQVQVPCFSLESLFARHGVRECDLLKIDIEGSEYDVLLTAPADTLSSIRRIYGEYHPCNDRPDALDQLKARLRQASFQTIWVPQRNDRRYGMFFASRD